MFLFKNLCCSGPFPIGWLPPVLAYLSSIYKHHPLWTSDPHLFLFLSPHLRLNYPSSSMLPLLQGAFSELLFYSLSHTLGTRYVALYTHLFMFNVFTRPETHNLGFINGIHEPPETVPNSLCVHAYVCFVLLAEGLDLMTAQFPSSESRCISVVLGK